MATYYIANMPVSDELYHFGILGMKWGIRRYQNPDGSLTDEGKKRYLGNARHIQKDLNRLEQEYAFAMGDKYRAETSIRRGKDKRANLERAESRMKDIEADTWRLMSVALNQNYSTITSKANLSTVRAGKSFVYGYLGGIAGTLAFNSIEAALLGGYDKLYYKGNKHKVIPDGKKQSTIMVKL